MTTNAENNGDDDLVAVLADLHGNLVALEAVLTEAVQRGVERILIAGDIAWGPQPSETVALVKSLTAPTTTVRGNADREVADPETVDGDDFLHASTRWCAEQVGPAGRAWLAALPLTASIHIDGFGDILLCHGSPRSDIDELRPETDPGQIEAWLTGHPEPVIICGHTHLQFDRMADNRRIVNPGSVGLHYGVDGAQWALIGPDGVELRTTPYDRQWAATLTQKSGIPDADGFVAFLLDPAGT